MLGRCSRCKLGIASPNAAVCVREPTRICQSPRQYFFLTLVCHTQQTVLRMVRCICFFACVLFSHWLGWLACSYYWGWLGFAQFGLVWSGLDLFVHSYACLFSHDGKTHSTCSCRVLCATTRSKMVSLGRPYTQTQAHRGEYGVCTVLLTTTMGIVHKAC